MKPNQLKKLMNSLDITQADLSRICFNQVTQSDRVIVSTWLNGVKPIPRWVQQMLDLYFENKILKNKLAKLGYGIEFKEQ